MYDAGQIRMELFSNESMEINLKIILFLFYPTIRKVYTDLEVHVLIHVSSATSFRCVWLQFFHCLSIEIWTLWSMITIQRNHFVTKNGTKICNVSSIYSTSCMLLCVYVCTLIIINQFMFKLDLNSMIGDHCWPRYCNHYHFHLQRCLTLDLQCKFDVCVLSIPFVIHNWYIPLGIE